MYDTIMDLPLFKGIGEEQLSNMLEKTSMEFLKFEDGEIIAKEDERVRFVDFILSGHVIQRFPVENFDLAVEETLAPGSIPGVLHLFGLNTTFTGSCKAMGKVSILRITKAQYMQILQSDRIYMMNFVNLLSAAAQKMPELMMKGKGPSISRELEVLAFSIASKSAECVDIIGKDEEIADYCGSPLEVFKEWKLRESEAGRIILRPEGICIKSPDLKK